MHGILLSVSLRPSEFENEIPFTKPAPIDEIETKKQQQKK